ncbi:MAG: nucleotidyltransferase [Nitrospirae bacterium]|nr:nucleotidyltransferase [Nitrospirota bacterium]
MKRAELLRLLNEHSVEYVIVGAVAFPIHGYARATLDIDLFIRPTPENAKRTLQALGAFGYDTHEISANDLLTKKVLIRQYTIETDLHPFVKGVSFDHVWANKVTGQIEGVPVYFASLDDLIQMKKAAGRVKDREDLKVLRKVKKLKQ